MRAFTALLAAAVFLLAGCTGGPESHPSSPPPPETLRADPPGGLIRPVTDAVIGQTYTAQGAVPGCHWAVDSTDGTERTDGTETDAEVTFTENDARLRDNGQCGTWVLDR